MENIRIAIYIRLSMADEEKGRSKSESNSIINQRSLIHRFLDNHKELSAYPRTEFVDDGFTGTNTDRPAFQKMVGAIREGLFSICITKDFSRFSRDYIEMGDYLECLFPFLGVRYISINDGYDSDEYKGTTGGMDIVMRTIVYDAYSKDLSVKSKTGKMQGMKKGHRMGMPPYGYMPDPNKCARDVIDPEAAAVVRRIFEAAMKGMGTGEIAKMLNDDGVLAPSAYYCRKYPESEKFGSVSGKNCWKASQIWKILRKYAYTGATVGHMREQVAPCSKSFVSVRREDWIVVPGMHPAIVTEEEFELAQKVIVKSGKAKNSGMVYPLKSLVVCGNCGRKMVFHREAKRFLCPYGRNGGDSLCGHRSPKEVDFESIVFSAIKDYISMVEMKKELMKGKLSERKGKIKSDVEMLSECQRKIETLKKDKLALYERYCGGEFGKDEYLHRKKKVDSKIRECEGLFREKATEVEAMEGELIEGRDSERDVACAEFRGGQKLTYEMAHAFIEKILVYTGERLEIVWKFKDMFERVGMR